MQRSLSISSGGIEEENPLYLPQARTYVGSCALGSDIYLVRPGKIRELPVKIDIVRSGTTVFSGESNTAQVHRAPEELAACLVRKLTFPQDVFLMTST